MQSRRNNTTVAMTQASAIGATPEQANAMTPTPESETQAAKLRAAIFGAFDEANGDDAGLKAAKAAVGDAELRLFGTRERIFIRMSKYSADNALAADMLTSKLMSDALAAWVEARGKAGKNEATGATMSQFATELRRAMHPAARDHVKQAITQSRVEWEAERKAAADAKAAGTTVPVPLQAAFGKRHHMFASSKGTLQARIDRDAANAKGKALGSLTDVGDFAAVAEAQATAQRYNAKAAAAKVAKLAEQIMAINADFPDRRFASVLEDLSEIDANVLTNARAKFERSAAQARNAAPQPAPMPSPSGIAPQSVTPSATAPSAAPRLTKAQKRAAKEAAAANAVPANADANVDAHIEDMLDE